VVFRNEHLALSEGALLRELRAFVVLSFFGLRLAVGAATDRQFGAVTVLVGEKNGKYPHGNSLWVRGREATVVIDPSLSVVGRADELRGQADLIIQSHVHEDHVAGVHLFPRAKVYAHREDAPGLRSIDGLMDIYGYESLDEAMRQFVIDQFHYAARPDTHGFDDGEVFALGDTQVRVIHTPGHTRGHCVLLIEPEGVLFLGDIDLTGFGPYYGDAWSDLEDFERSLRKVRDIEARVWVSFHHVGVIDDRDTFLSKLDHFAARIAERDAALLEFLAQPRSLTEMVRHRFLYRPHVDLPFIDAAERRTIEQHLARLLQRAQVERCDVDVYRRVNG
jgi:glyoxylase-like metal-dependent hydrolase (beta-lactamase superfamily II)